MATVTHATGTADTGASPNTSGAFTPALGDVLVVFVIASATTQAVATLTSSVSMTFVQFLRATAGGSTNSLYGFVSVGRVTAASSQTVTADMNSDASTGTIIFINRVSGLYRTGLSAVRQSAKTDNGVAATVPTATFGSSVRTQNPTLVCLYNATNPAGFAPPSGWTEPATTGDLGYATPTTGGEMAYRNSGFTGTLVDWVSTSSAYCTMAVELDTRPAACPSITSQARQRAASW